MIQLTTLYDEYIDRSKPSEQKKNPVEYIVPPPSRGVRTITIKNDILTFFYTLMNVFILDPEQATAIKFWYAKPCAKMFLYSISDKFKPKF